MGYISGSDPRYRASVAKVLHQKGREDTECFKIPAYSRREEMV